jgi:hypothetical protein
MPHACLIVKSDQDLMDGVCDFVLAGLKGGEMVVAVVDKERIGPLLRQLERIDSEVAEDAIRDSQLFIWTPEETYILGGVFSPAKMIALIQQLVGDAYRRGFKKMRGVGEINWAMTGLPGSQDIFDYESRINRLVRGKPNISFLCVYDERVFPRRTIEETLRVHGQKQ